MLRSQPPQHGVNSNVQVALLEEEAHEEVEEEAPKDETEIKVEWSHASTQQSSELRTPPSEDMHGHPHFAQFPQEPFSSR
ncbi:hypothetical protein LguiB_007145 [Lonicera macranthoides]